MYNKTGLGTPAIVLISIGILALLAFMWVSGTYNSLVSLDENLNQRFGNIQSAYQRRADLIPNLVATVKTSAAFEKELQTQIAGLRSGIVNAQAPAEMEVVSQRINSALTFAFEAYPNIKTTDQFQQLGAQLEGTENRIKVERDNYNGAVKDYNVQVRRFPGNIIAGMFGFGLKESFSATEGAEKAPDVNKLFE